MHRLLYFSILLGSLLPSKAAHINVTNVNATNVNETYIETVEEIDHANETAAQIEILQEEKEDLYIKINKAIDEAIPELEKSNDTDAITGLENLKTLKKQIKEIHEGSDSYERNSSDVNTNFRRKISISIDRQGKHDWNKQKKKNEFYEKLAKSKDKKYTSLPRVLNRQKIAEQIQLWLLKQQEEKRKIREMQVKLKIDFERCPDFGRGREKKKKTSNGKGVKSHYFPCCRKCCKKSYLGCL
ncbi:uncharacterized protein LOC133531225 isoform X2 [Cydia pomonella]|uniref:uncharacterized protein LOC133531225 isoform X2 n=1 Tax=Cydia pomonella TaxID=82600 RepID=UPI002ADE1351|nr:uncharacterized protein LOC133531225 isoform X2 [Cydia pomonella]